MYLVCNVFYVATHVLVTCNEKSKSTSVSNSQPLA